MKAFLKSYPGGPNISDEDGACGLVFAPFSLRATNHFDQGCFCLQLNQDNGENAGQHTISSATGAKFTVMADVGDDVYPSTLQVDWPGNLSASCLRPGAVAVKAMQSSDWNGQWMLGLTGRLMVFQPIFK